MKKNYITPKTQVKTLDTEMLLAGSKTFTIDPDTTTNDGNGGLAKKGVSIWEED